MRSLLSMLAGWKGYAAVALLAAVAAGTVQEWRHGAKYARLERDHASLLERQAHAVVETVMAAKRLEEQRVAAVEKERDVAIERIETLAADVAVGRTVSERLRDELATLRAYYASLYSPTAERGEGQSGTDPIGMLIDMYAGLDEAGREVAEYADKLRIAGLACETSFDQIRVGTSIEF